MQSCDVNPPDENPDCFWGKVPVDQWTYCEKLLEMGTEKGAAAQGGSKLMDRLHNHWESWVTRENIVSLANVGITHLRLPIGHWILGDIEPPEPYVNGEWPYVLRLVGWAREFGLKVWLDLHTAPGSQNGFDNSGRLGNLTWDKSYHNVWRTVKIIEEIASQVRIDGALDIITGFGVMNEPGPYVPVELLMNFYNDAYIAIRRSMPDAYIGTPEEKLDLLRHGRLLRQHAERGLGRRREGRSARHAHLPVLHPLHAHDDAAGAHRGGQSLSHSVTQSLTRWNSGFLVFCSFARS
jgi:hypothetical protein